jgi:ribosomal protein L37AE/L43A
MKSLSLRSRAGSLVCPLCEVDKLNTHGHSSARCDSCGVLVSEATLEALNQITVLPDALGRHACEECGHPEMRLLPDGTHHCPACGSEVVPLDARASLSEPDEHGEAWWAGWMDGHFGELSSFVENPSLRRWEDPSERLAYYIGHRAGSEARRTSSSSSNSDAREKLFG